MLGFRHGEIMTEVELAGLIVGSVGTVAAIIAAWGVVVDRLEKHAERKAQELTSLEEAILCLANVSPGDEIRVGQFLNGGGSLLVVPHLEGRCLVVSTDAPLKRLMACEFMTSETTGAILPHGPQTTGWPIGFTQVTIFRLRLSGRFRAAKIPLDILRTEIAKSGLDGNYL